MWLVRLWLAQQWLVQQWLVQLWLVQLWLVQLWLVQLWLVQLWLVQQWLVQQWWVRLWLAHQLGFDQEDTDCTICSAGDNNFQQYNIQVRPTPDLRTCPKQQHTYRH
jgi:hypothetical protein